mgnify:CR=1 FL=1
MSAKVFLYLFSSIVVIWSIDSVNINQIFKKNKINQAKVFYFLLAICMIELLTSFLYNLFEATKFI